MGARASDPAYFDFIGRRNKLKRMMLFLSLMLLTATASCAKAPELYWNFQSDLVLSVEEDLGTNDIFIAKLKGHGLKEDVAVEIAEVSEGIFEFTVSAPESAENISEDGCELTLKKKGLFGKKFSYSLYPDFTAPQISIIAQSSQMRRGGSAVIVAASGDEHGIRGVSVSDGNGTEFYAQQFIQKGFYATLFGWDVSEEDLDFVLIAEDFAGNRTTNEIDLEKLSLDYVVSRLDFYTPEPSTNESEETTTTTTVQKEEGPDPLTIWEVTMRVPDSDLGSWHLDPFNPIDQAILSSGFGKLRNYYMDGVWYKQSYHSGLDMFKSLNNPITVSNPGRVVYARYNIGGYGYTSVIDHGFGLYSLYAHCSGFEAFEGQSVEAGQTVAYTGSSGSATGDHLHFGIRVQTADVNPNEWMDETWMKENIYDVLDQAKKIVSEQAEKE